MPNPIPPRIAPPSIRSINVKGLALTAEEIRPRITPINPYFCDLFTLLSFWVVG